MNILRHYIQSADSIYTMQTEIPYTPSVGLIIYEPIYATIGTVVYEKGHFVATTSEIAVPTNPETQIDYLLEKGWIVEYTMKRHGK